MPYLDRAAGPRLHYEIDDFSDPWRPAGHILLQHGYARSSRFWRAWVPYLSRDYKVLRPDLRGLGLSSKDFDLERLNIGDYVDDLCVLLDGLQIEAVHFCGELSAGILGMAFAAAHPDRVKTLALISSPVFMTEEDKNSALCGYGSRVEALRKLGARGWLEASNAGRRLPKHSDPAMLAWTLDEMSLSDTEVLVAYFRWVSEHDATPLLRRIRAPVLALYPQEGPIIKEEHIQRLRENVARLELIRIDSTSRSLHLTEPERCAREILRFISTHDGLSSHAVAQDRPSSP